MWPDPNPKVESAELSTGDRYQLVVRFSDGAILYIDGPWHATDPKGAAKFATFARDYAALLGVRKALSG